MSTTKTSTMTSTMTDNSIMNTDLECIFTSHHPVDWLSCYVYVESFDGVILWRLNLNC